MLGRTSEGLADFDRVVSLDPSGVSDRAWAYVSLGRLEDAISDCDRAIKLAPSPWVYGLRAYIETFKPGLCDRAAADLRKAEELMPKGEWGIWMQLARIHVTGLVYSCPEHYDARAALEYARKAFWTRPSRSNYHGSQWVLGVALYRNGRYEEAVAAIKKWLPENEETSGDLFFLAMASQRLGRTQEARAYYDRAVAWMEKRMPADLGCLRVKREAAELLGVHP